MEADLGALLGIDPAFAHRRLTHGRRLRLLLARRAGDRGGVATGAALVVLTVGAAVATLPTPRPREPVPDAVPVRAAPSRPAAAQIARNLPSEAVDPLPTDPDDGPHRAVVRATPPSADAPHPTPRADGGEIEPADYRPVFAQAVAVGPAPPLPAADPGDPVSPPAPARIASRTLEDRAEPPVATASQIASERERRISIDAIRALRQR